MKNFEGSRREKPHLTVKEISAMASGAWRDAFFEVQSLFHGLENVAKGRHVLRYPHASSTPKRKGGSCGG